MNFFRNISISWYSYLIIVIIIFVFLRNIWRYSTWYAALHRSRKKFWFYDTCLCFIFNNQLYTQTVLRNVFWIRYVGLPSPAYDSIFGRVRERIFLKWTSLFVSRLKQLTKNRISTSCRWMKMRCCHRHCRVTNLIVRSKLEIKTIWSPKTESNEKIRYNKS